MTAEIKPYSAGFEQERERMHRSMLSSVSHDLKTPLASIIGSLEIYERMKDKLTDDRKQALLETALEEAYRLDNFITNILDMAKFENGAVKIQSQSCNVGSAIEDCLVRLGQRAKDSEIKIKPLSGNLEVTTDPVLLSRAMYLIIDNAIKYGGKDALIHIEYGQVNQTAFIRVRDHGQGIPDHLIDTIFCKYTRLARQDHQSAGTGLGLAICQEIMRLLSGGVTAQNAADSGAIFELTFPIAK